MGDPQRIQLRRIKGWRKPDGAVVVARSSPRWGNPLAVGETLTAEGPGGFPFDFTVTPDIAVDFYRQLMEVRLWTEPSMHPDDRAYSDAWRAALDELRGRDLACWCPLDQSCHADVLLELANRVGAEPDPEGEL